MLNIRDIEITDEDIDWVEELMGENIEFNLQRRTIIKNLEPRDIQAFPGSGKTTVLVAKLAILAKKWESNSSGICVLSHTNVAREEIEKRLGSTKIGAKLLAYPHFIGTVHSFFSKFIALPWLKSQRKPIEVIDTEITVNYRWRKIPRNYRNALERRKKFEIDCVYSREIGNIDLGKIGSHTQTYKEVIKVIEQSHNEGFYTYDEILLFSREALNQNNNLSTAISSRFPIVFIDEAQDTNEFQYNLINDSFTFSVEQGFGDENQAIYNYINGPATTRFPRPDPLIIDDSKRFSNDIAQLANNLAVSETMMVGSNNRFEGNKHTIFLFSKDSIENVFEEYGKLVLETFPEEELNNSLSNGIYAIGLVHRKTGETLLHHYPKGLYDYFPSYNPQSIREGFQPRFLVDYFMLGKYEFEKDRETHRQINYILEGLRALINRVKGEGFIKRNHISQFKNFTDILAENSIIGFKVHLLRLHKMDLEDRQDWENILLEIDEIMELMGIKLDTSSEFFNWRPLYEIGYRGGKVSPEVENVYLFEKENRKIPIKLDSIHGVKGKTHLATLVLETFNHGHCLKRLIPFITESASKTGLGTRDIQKMKTHYVAMTRPKGLLCLGLPNDQVSATEVERLKEVGWRVIEV